MISYVPGLYKIFNEVLVYAAKNKQSGSIDVKKKTITVYNNGAGIPMEKRKEPEIYAPALIFGYLDDDSNINGYGVKLANIFSTEFTIETADGEKSFKQVQTITTLMKILGF